MVRQPSPPSYSRAAKYRLQSHCLDYHLGDWHKKAQEMLGGKMESQKWGIEEVEAKGQVGSKVGAEGVRRN